MNLKTKKLIAREFVLLVLCLVIVLLSYLSFSGYNLIIKYKRDAKASEITYLESLSDSLQTLYSQKELNQNEFTNRFNQYGFEYIRNPVLWRRLLHLAKTDSVRYYWDNLWTTNIKDYLKSQGFTRPLEFKKFILQNIINRDDVSNKKIIAQNNLQIYSLRQLQIKYHHQIVTVPEIESYLLTILTVTLALVFLIRPFFYALKWSLNILKHS